MRLQMSILLVLWTILTGTDKCGTEIYWLIRLVNDVFEKP